MNLLCINFFTGIYFLPLNIIVYVYQLFWQFKILYTPFFIVNIWRHIWQITIRLIGIGSHFQSQRSPYLRMVWCKFWLTYSVYIWQHISIVRECIKNTKMAKKKKKLEFEKNIYRNRIFSTIFRWQAGSPINNAHCFT